MLCLMWMAQEHHQDFVEARPDHLHIGRCRLTINNYTNGELLKNAVGSMLLGSMVVINAHQVQGQKHLAVAYMTF